MKKTLYLMLLLILSVAQGARAQDPDIEDNEFSVLEELFRTSELDDETPTNTRARRASPRDKRMSAPLGAQRVGCICMDDTRSDAHSSGACSGRGGVRYWLYRTLEGDTLRVLTARHERHPHPLDSVERSALNPPAAPKSPRGGSSTVVTQLQPIIISATPAPGGGQAPVYDGGWFDWSDAATVTGGGITLYLSLRLLLRWIDSHQALVRYALRHLLRFGKRPAPRSRRKTPPKTGV